MHGVTNIAFYRACLIGLTEGGPPSQAPVLCAPWPGLQASSCRSSGAASRGSAAPDDAKRTLATRTVTGGQPARSTPPPSRDHACCISVSDAMRGWPGVVPAPGRRPEVGKRLDEPGQTMMVVKSVGNHDPSRSCRIALLSFCAPGDD